MPDLFTVDIVAIFLGNTWQTNVVNILVMFQGMGTSTFTFLSAPNAALVVEGQNGVTFYMSPTVHMHPLLNLFPSSA